MRDAREEERQRLERERKKKAEYDAKQEEAFERDKRNRLLAEQKGDAAALIERETEKQIS